MHAMAVSASLQLGILLGMMSILVYARHVVLDAQGLLPARKQNSKQAARKTLAAIVMSIKLRS